MYRLLFTCLLLKVFVLPSSAQNYAVYNSYYLNPFLYNPAEAATEFSYVFVNHRQQWMGIEGAPVLTTFNFNTMLDNSRAGIGVKASTFSRGLLSTTDVAVTYAYGVSFSEKNMLFFGLSGGAISNQIDMTQTDAQDPALAGYMVNNLQPAANFGMAFHSTSGLHLSVALPRLFTPKFNSIASFEHKDLSPFDEVVIATYFRRKVEGKLVSRKKRGVRAKVRTNDAYAPLELYALYKYSKSGISQFEVMGKLNLSENVWLGASYRQAYGVTGSVGFAFNRLLLAYSYEPGNQPEPAFSTGTHEVQLGLRLGDAKKFRRAAPILRSTLKSSNQPEHSARFGHQDDPEASQSPETARRKYLVVVKVFAEFTQADALKKKLIEQKYNANVFYNKKDRKFYVHVFETTKSGEAQAELKNLKTYSKLRDVKVVTINIE